VRLFDWRLAACAAAASLALAGCEQKRAAAPAPPPDNVKAVMDSIMDPSGDFLFESVVDVSDDKGTRREAPQTDADWAEVQHHLDQLNEGVRRLSVPGLAAAGPGDKSLNPEVELQPAEIDKLLATDHADFLRRAGRLKDAAAEGSKAVKAKDVEGLLKALTAIDHACESCHLKFWYPKDERAHINARLEGVIE